MKPIFASSKNSDNNKQLEIRFVLRDGNLVRFRQLADKVPGCDVGLAVERGDCLIDFIEKVLCAAEEKYNPTNLTTYLMQHLGEKISELRVISARGTLGIVKMVTWDICAKTNEIDEETSWVSIKWENGNYSDDNVLNLVNVKINT